MRLADCRWVEDRQDLILTGPCGSGKSFLASMLGQQACIHGYTVCYWPAGKLFEQMKLYKADDTYLRELAKISKKRLLIVDDFGLEVLDTASRLNPSGDPGRPTRSRFRSLQFPTSRFPVAPGHRRAHHRRRHLRSHRAHRSPHRAQRRVGAQALKRCAHRGRERKKEPS